MINSPFASLNACTNTIVILKDHDNGHDVDCDHGGDAWLLASLNACTTLRWWCIIIMIVDLDDDFVLFTAFLSLLTTIVLIAILFWVKRQTLWSIRWCDNSMNWAREINANHCTVYTCVRSSQLYHELCGLTEKSEWVDPTTRFSFSGWFDPAASLMKLKELIRDRFKTKGIHTSDLKQKEQNRTDFDTWEIYARSTLPMPAQRDLNLNRMLAQHYYDYESFSELLDYYHHTAMILMMIIIITWASTAMLFTISLATARFFTSTLSTVTFLVWLWWVADGGVLMMVCLVWFDYCGVLLMVCFFWCAS